MRLVALCAVLAASIGAQTQTQATQSPNVAMQRLGRQVMLDSLATWTTVSYPPRLVLKAAALVLQEYKLQIEVNDSLHGAIYNRQLRLRRSLGDHPMSWALHCGTGLSGDNADSWRITAGYAVFALTAPENGSRLGIALTGSAEDPSGAGHRVTECETSGNFEQEFLNTVKLRLAAQ